MIPKNFPDPGIRSVAAAYLGREPAQPSKAKPDPAASARTAALYAQTPHAPHDPAVAASYAALKRETKAQYEHLLRSGVRLEPWTQPGQPYANSDEMMRDARANKHLYFYTGGDMPKDHPLAEEALPGLTYNDLFRAVHDYFGHAMHGHQFGPTGEYRAWADHSDMFSPEAVPAMTAETHGQNSWVNFGPHSHLPVTERPYAEQKAMTLPPEHHPIKLLRAFEAHRIDYTTPAGVRRQRTITTRMDPIDLHRKLREAGHTVHSLTPATPEQLQKREVRRVSSVSRIEKPREVQYRPGLEPPAKLSRPTAKQITGASVHPAFRGTALAYHMARLAKYAKDRYGAKANPLLQQVRSIMSGRLSGAPLSAVGRYLSQYAGASVPEALHGIGDKVNWETADRRHGLDAALYSFVHDTHGKGDQSRTDRAIREINVRLQALPDEKRREITAKLAKHLRGQKYVGGDSHSELLSSLGRLATYAKDREMVRGEHDDARDKALRSYLEGKGMTAHQVLQNADENRTLAPHLTAALAKAAGTKGTHEQVSESLRRLTSNPAPSSAHVGWRQWFESAKRWVHTPGGRVTEQKRADPLRLARKPKEPKGISTKLDKRAGEEKEQRDAAKKPPLSEDALSLLKAHAANPADLLPLHPLADAITEAGHDYHGSVLADALHGGHVWSGPQEEAPVEINGQIRRAEAGHTRLGIIRLHEPVTGPLARTVHVLSPDGHSVYAVAPTTASQLLEMVKNVGAPDDVKTMRRLLKTGNARAWGGKDAV